LPMRCRPPQPTPTRPPPWGLCRIWLCGSVKEPTGSDQAAAKAAREGQRGAKRSGKSGPKAICFVFRRNSVPPSPPLRFKGPCLYARARPEKRMGARGASPSHYCFQDPKAKIANSLPANFHRVRRLSFCFCCLSVYAQGKTREIRGGSDAEDRGAR